MGMRVCPWFSTLIHRVAHRTWGWNFGLIPFWDYNVDIQIVALRNLDSYWKQPHRGDAEGALKAWFAEAKLAQWTTPQDVKKQYANASIIANNRVVFNIKGNDYRLIVAIAYKMKYVYVKFIGTHAEYNKVDAATVDQFKGA